MRSPHLPSAIGAVILILVGLVLASPSQSEPPPSACLSWESDITSANRNQPIGSGAPLFLRLSNVPAGAAFAVELTWSPNDLVGPCYWLAPAGGAVVTCGGTFGPEVADSLCDTDTGGRYWSITFAEGVDHACVPFLVQGGAGCGSSSATFCIANITMRIGASACEPVDIAGCATLFGGNGECPAGLLAAQPSIITTGRPTSLHLQGSGFASGMSVELSTPSGSVRSDSTVILGPAEAVAFLPPAQTTGSADLIVTNAAGEGDTLAGAITIAPASPAYASSHLIAVFRPGRIALGAGQVGTNHPAEATESSSLENTLAAAGVLSLESCAPNCLLDPALACSLKNPSQIDVFELALADTSVMTACAILLADTLDVLDAHPDYYLHLDGSWPTPSRFDDQWWLKNVGRFLGAQGMDAKITQAWTDYTTGGERVDVGVIDDGVDTTVAGIAGRAHTYWPTPNGIWNDGGVGGRDVYPHGTCVASIIAATGRGVSPVAGVDWTAHVVNLKATGNHQFWGQPESLSVSAVLRALDIAMALHLPIVNISAGTDMPSTELETGCRNYFHQGGLIVASVGNYNDRTVGFPAGYSTHVAAAGASDFFGQRWDDTRIPWNQYGTPIYGRPYSGTQYGPNLWLLAPGGRFIQTAPPRNVDNWTYFHLDSTATTQENDSQHLWGFGGTSAAAPVIAGAAALARSIVGSSLNGEDMRALLEQTAVVRYDPILRVNWLHLDVQAALGAVSSKRVLHGLGVGGHVVEHQGGLATTVHYWPGSPALGEYTGERYRVELTVPLPEPMTTTPRWWTRRIGSMGADSLPMHIWHPNHWQHPRPAWEPKVDPVSATSSSVTMRTNVYRLTHTVTGSQFWWPCDTAAVQFAFTYVGIPMSALSVDPNTSTTSPSLACAPALAHSDVSIQLTGLRGEPLKLDILDLQGRLVRTLVHGIAPVGTVNRGWDLTDSRGNGVSSGIYFVRASFGGRGSLSRRVTVVR